MATRTGTQVWPTEVPLVVFISPGEDPERYAYATKFLMEDAIEELGWDGDAIYSFGLISQNRQSTIEGLFFLEETGIDPREITLLILWGETSEHLQFEDSVPTECGLGFLALVKSGVVLPVLRMPSLESGWWNDGLHQDYASHMFTEAVKDGRLRPTVGDRPSDLYTSRMYN